MINGSSNKRIAAELNDIKDKCNRLQVELTDKYNQIEKLNNERYNGFLVTELGFAGW